MTLHRVGRLAALALAVALALAAGCARARKLAYEGFGRDGWQQPERVVEALGLGPDERVADLGAGGGYFTFRLADAVRPGGRVWAVDVDRGLLDLIEGRAAEEGRGDVSVVLAPHDDPALPEPVDWIFTCNTYHHLRDGTAYFERARRYLRPGGRVAIIEYRESGWLQRFFAHSTSPERIRTEMERAGYRLEREHDFLERQSFLVFALD